jgi:hypothetical protein
MAQLDFHPTFITTLEGVSQVHELIKLTWKARCATTTRELISGAKVQGNSQDLSEVFMPM